MRIPEIQSRLIEIGTELENSEIVELARELSRRPSIRGPNDSEPMTEEKRRQIWTPRRQNPDWSNQKIANCLKINPGRVSETLRGFRK